MATIKIHSPTADAEIPGEFEVVGSFYDPNPFAFEVRVSINNYDGVRVYKVDQADRYTNGDTGVVTWKAVIPDAAVPGGVSYCAVAIAYNGTSVLACDSCNFTKTQALGKKRPPKKKAAKK